MVEYQDPVEALVGEGKRGVVGGDELEIRMPHLGLGEHRGGEIAAGDHQRGVENAQVADHATGAAAGVEHRGRTPRNRLDEVLHHRELRSRFVAGVGQHLGVADRHLVVGGPRVLHSLFGHVGIVEAARSPMPGAPPSHLRPGCQPVNETGTPSSVMSKSGSSNRTRSTASCPLPRQRNCSEASSGASHENSPSNTGCRRSSASAS